MKIGLVLLMIISAMLMFATTVYARKVQHIVPQLS